MSPNLENQMSFLESEFKTEDLSFGFGDSEEANGRQIRKLEADLYAPVAAVLRDFWIPHEELREAIVEVTANQGSRKTGGLWTRPDLVVIGICAYAFVPGRSLNLTTFEIKKSISEGIEGVYEAAAHSSVSHRSFLMLYDDGQLVGEDVMDRIRSECHRFGLGLMIFTDPGDWRTYQSLTYAIQREPNIASINKFIATQISEVSRHRLLTMFR